MPYTEPTTADLKARYPAFANVADETIAYWLTDAARYVDQSWTEADYAPAKLAAAAHGMVRAAVAGIAGSDVDEIAGAGVTSFKSGNFSVQFSEAAAVAAAGGGWDSTKYGAEYLALLRRNKGGIGVTGAGCVTGWGSGFNRFAGPLPPYVCA